MVKSFFKIIIWPFVLTFLAVIFFFLVFHFAEFHYTFTEEKHASLEFFVPAIRNHL